MDENPKKKTWLLVGTPSSMVDTDRALDVSRVLFTVRLWSYQKIPTSAYPQQNTAALGGVEDGTRAQF